MQMGKLKKLKKLSFVRSKRSKDTTPISSTPWDRGVMYDTSSIERVLLDIYEHGESAYSN